MACMACFIAAAYRRRKKKKEEDKAAEDVFKGTGPGVVVVDLYEDDASIPSVGISMAD